ncbi:hypothetical protein Pcinc_034761 [Petrolisthes cinctipes]|uniref:Uncharacterized protein n=1 Tax=Petrolisthes cinctipes TaxID=88211 RepID=A0AAE1BXX7_PETCI|nr:hypothetical protein Pcinc_034761 [Petrolisthes cinctipes]
MVENECGLWKGRMGGWMDGWMEGGGGEGEEGSGWEEWKGVTMLGCGRLGRMEEGRKKSGGCGMMELGRSWGRVKTGAVVGGGSRTGGTGDVFQEVSGYCRGGVGGM